MKDIPVIFLLGGLGFAVYQTALNYGEQTVSAGAASLIVSTTPIISALLALVILKERFGRQGWIGSLIALFGMIFVSFGSGDSVTINVGIFFILLAAFSESIYFVFQKKYFDKYGFIPFTTYTILGGTLFMLMYLPGLTEALLSAPVRVTYTVIYLGLFPTILPYFCLAYIISKIGTAEATSSLYLTPILTFIIEWLWIGELPSLLTIVGGIITLIGVFVVNWKLEQRKKISLAC